jgi:translation initiation factor IF-2
MSSTESSGAPAEATATTPASNAEASFGSTRGSGLARGKGKRHTAPAAATAASSDYTPTAIAVVTAPREYQNPFAPVETPAAVTAEPVAPVASVPVAHVPEKAHTAPVHTEAVQEVTEEAPAPVESDEHAELNILPPEQQRNAPAQTWESEGFRPAREPRGDRPRREDSRRNEPRREETAERAPFDPSTIPEKFLYVRPGYNYVPTPSNYGGAPREPRGENRPASTPAYSAPATATPAKSGGFFGWLKSLFGGSDAAPAPAAAQSGEHRSGDRSHGDRHRGGRGRGQGGGGDGQRRRSRGGRGRNSQRGEYRGGGDQGGPSAT